MNICTFFGHSDCGEGVRPLLRQVVEAHIVQRGVKEFYVGNHGRFDALVLSVLRELNQSYPQIAYSVVLAYMPNAGKPLSYRLGETVIPEGIENVPPRYAIAYRNDWMLRKADFVITYVRYSTGASARYAKKAIHRKKP